MFRCLTNERIKLTQVPWWLKIGIKAVCVAAGLGSNYSFALSPSSDLNSQDKKSSSSVAMVFGVSACLSLSPVCIVAGIWQISAGFILIVIEVSHSSYFAIQREAIKSHGVLH